MLDPANYQTGAGLFIISVFAVISFWIEILASKNVNRRIVINEKLMIYRFKAWLL